MKANKMINKNKPNMKIIKEYSRSKLRENDYGVRGYSLSEMRCPWVAKAYTYTLHYRTTSTKQGTHVGT